MTGNAWEIARIIEPHVARVVVVSGIWHANEAVREAERELARQAELAYQRSVRDWHAAHAKGAGATPGRASSKPSCGKQRGSASVPNAAL